MAATILPKIITVPPTGKHTATFFFFHGSGGSANEIKQYIDILNRKEFKFSHIKVVYPNAPEQPYTPLDGMLSNVWFDRKSISQKAPEVKESIEKICKTTSELIDKEVESGVSLNRIIVGGFSMGGALSMYLAYRYKTSLAGCVAASSFLNDNSIVYEYLKTIDGKSTPPLLQFHGLADMMVPFSWGKTTSENLGNFGVKTEIIKLPGVEHELVRTEVEKLNTWLLEKLPENIA